MYESRNLKGIKEIARYLGCHRTTVLRYIEAGLPAAKLGGVWVTSPQVIDMWILTKHPQDVAFKQEIRAIRRLRAAASGRLLNRPSEMEQEDAPDQPV